MKRSAAATASALAEPEDEHVPEPSLAEALPAPAGALHRPFAPGTPRFEAHRSEPEEEYIPQRGSYRMRLRGGIPRSVAGRILLASLSVIVLGLFVLLVAAVRQFLLHDPRFAVSGSSAIAVEGNEHISRADVLSVFGADLERNIFRIPLADRRADLERLPWVAHATVERLLPNHLRIRVRERVPIAFVRQGAHIGLVDADGVLLDMPPDSAGDLHYSFPVLTGLSPDDSPELRTARMEVYRRFMADLDSSGQHHSGSLSEVDVTNPEDVKALVTLGGSDVLVHFGDEDFLGRYNAFARHLPEWRTQYPKLASADMRYERQVVLEMSDSPAATPADTAVSPAPKADVAASGLAGPHQETAAAHHGSAGGHTASPVRLNASEQRARELALRRVKGRSAFPGRR